MQKDLDFFHTFLYAERLKRAKKWILLTFGFIVLQLLISTYLMNRGQLTIAALTPSDQDLEKSLLYSLDVKQVKIVGLDNQNHLFQASADEVAQVPETRDDYAFSNLRSHLTLNDNGDWMSLMADTGHYQRSLSRVALEKNIVLDSSSGMHLTTEQAFINLPTRSVTVTTPLRMNDLQGNQVYAEGLEMTLDQRIKLIKNSQMILSPNAMKPQQEPVQEDVL